MRDISWWARAQGEGFPRYELAGRRMPGGLVAAGASLAGVTDADADWIDYSDPAGGAFRAVAA